MDPPCAERGRRAPLLALSLYYTLLCAKRKFFDHTFLRRFRADLQNTPPGPGRAFRRGSAPFGKYGYFPPRAHRYNESMNYVKKLCILKQVSPGFAADGKAVSALLTCEQFAGKVTMSLAMIGFAELSAGRYRCLVCDEHGTAEIFDVPAAAGTTVRRASALDIADGLGCAVCFVHGRVTCAAFGKCGDKTYDLKRLCALLDAEENPAPKSAAAPSRAGAREKAESGRTAPPAPGADGPPPGEYDDELVADENYYAFADADEGPRTGEKEDGNEKDAPEGTAPAKRGEDAGEDAHDQSLFRFAGAQELGEDERACYYDTVKAELDALFAKHPAETALEQSIPHSRWVRVEFAQGKYYVVGVVRRGQRPQYICYGVPSPARKDPPDALRKYSSYVPVSLFSPDGAGYWMMFQDAETGRCVKLAQS